MPQKFGIRQIWTGPEVDYILNHNNELEEWEISYTNWFELSSGDSIFFNVERSFERLDEVFDFREGVEIPIGDYQSNSFGFRLSSSDSRAISTSIGGGIEDFYKGQVRRGYLQTTLKPNGHLSVSAQYQFNQIVDLPASYFIDGQPQPVYVNLFRGRGGLLFYDWTLRQTLCAVECRNGRGIYQFPDQLHLSSRQRFLFRVQSDLRYRQHHQICLTRFNHRRGK